MLDSFSSSYKDLDVVPKQSIFPDRQDPAMETFLEANGLDPMSAHDDLIIELMNTPHSGVTRAEHTPLTRDARSQHEQLLSQVDTGLYTPMAHALGARAIQTD